MVAVEVRSVPWEPHPEVWLLIAAVVALGVYTVRVIQPVVVARGESPVSARQRWWFAGAVTVLWLASDWPVHDVGEKYLYSVHMVQHLLLTFVAPPLFLLACPSWLFRLLIGADGPEPTRFARVFGKATRPVPAALAFNAIVILTHWSAMVTLAVDNGPVHYLLHTAVITVSLMAWTPVCAPATEYRASPPTQMIHLFGLSVIPTIPGAWLANADGVVYGVYDRPLRLFGISVTEDQQMAGVIMKVLGGFYLWTIIAIIFFRWMGQSERQGSRFRGTLVLADGTRVPPPGEGSAASPGIPVSSSSSSSSFGSAPRQADHPLTYEEVVSAFDRVEAAPEDPLRT